MIILNIQIILMIKYASIEFHNLFKTINKYLDLEKDAKLHEYGSLNS